MAEGTIDLSGMPLRQWLEYRRFSLTADYLRRGRANGRLSTPALRLRWLEVLVEWSNHYESDTLRDRACDLQLELFLRQEEPPWRIARPILRRLHARARQHHRSLSPQAAAKAAASTVAEIRRVSGEIETAIRH
ncbi:MAG: hypothetical protein IT562_23430 [Alphaproteobacteria bacterium]|nr:hypothetical protein [Alphaproteobacteria bacterium]